MPAAQTPPDDRPNKQADKRAVEEHAPGNRAPGAQAASSASVKRPLPGKASPAIGGRASRTVTPPLLPRQPLPHDDVDRPVVGFLHDYVDAGTIGRHRHRRAQLISSASGVMQIITDGGSYVVPPGWALWVPAELPHAVIATSGLAMRALFLREDAARAGPAAATVLAVSSLLQALILAACAEPLEWDEAGRGHHLSALILDEIRRAPALPFGLPTPRDPRLQRLAEALRAAPANPQPLSGWARQIGASTRTLERLFQQETGMGFRRWRQVLRLTQAAALLAQGVPAARAAEQVGYASLAAFGAAFRGCFGATPGQVARRRG